jgi:hypothetical protein
MRHNKPPQFVEEEQVQAMYFSNGGEISKEVTMICKGILAAGKRS